MRYMCILPTIERALQMPRKEKVLKGGAAENAKHALRAAKITSRCRCFQRRVEAARSRANEERCNTDSPTARERIQTAYEAAVTNLHLVLDSVLDNFWADIEDCVKSALMNEKQAFAQVECAQKAYALAAGVDAPAGQCEHARRALQQLDQNVVGTCLDLEQGAAHTAGVATACQKAASELSAAQSSHQRILSRAGWKLENIFIGFLDAAARQKRVVIPMLPPLLGLPYFQDCRDEPLAADLKTAFTYQATPEGKQDACAAFVALFCQQACWLCPTRKITGVTPGWPESLESAAQQIYLKWDSLVTDKSCHDRTKACDWVADFDRPTFMEARAIEFLQNGVGTLLQDCADTRVDARPDATADCADLPVSAAQSAEPSTSSALAQHEFDLHEASLVSELVQPDVLEEGWTTKRKRSETLDSAQQSGAVACTSARGVDLIPQLKRPPRVGVELARRYLEKLRGRRKKGYADCSKDQKAQDRAWLLACAGSKPQLMHMVGDIVNASVENDGLLDLLLSYLDDSKVVRPCRRAIETRVHVAPLDMRGSDRELELEVALALFFETGISWSHYHTLTHIWRISTGKGDLRFPSKCRLYQHYKQMQTEVLTMPVVVSGEAAGNFVCRTAESGWEAVRERVQRVADAAYKAANGRFEPYLEGVRKVICNISADGFTVPNFVKEVIHFVQANVRVLLDGADAGSYLTSHIPLMLGRAKETYATYSTVWPYVEAPFLTDGKPRTEMMVMWGPEGERVRHIPGLLCVCMQESVSSQTMTSRLSGITREATFYGL